MDIRIHKITVFKYSTYLKMLRQGFLFFLATVVSADVLQHSAHSHTTNAEPIVHSILDMESRLDDMHRRQHKISQVAEKLLTVRKQLYSAVSINGMDIECHKPCNIVGTVSNQSTCNLTQCTGELTCKIGHSGRRLHDILQHPSENTIVKTNLAKKMLLLSQYQCRVEDMERRAEILSNVIPDLKKIYMDMKEIVSIEGMTKRKKLPQIVHYDGYNDYYHDHHDEHYHDDDDHHDDHYHDDDDHYHDDDDHHDDDHCHDDDHYHDYHDGWKRLVDSHGRMYWANHLTGQTQWDDPHHRRLHSIRYHIHNLMALQHKKAPEVHGDTQPCNDEVGQTNCIDLIVKEIDLIGDIQEKIDDFEERLLVLHDGEEAVVKAIDIIEKATDTINMK